jgi:hypothetical protein
MIIDMDHPDVHYIKCYDKHNNFIEFLQTVDTKNMIGSAYITKPDGSNSISFKTYKNGMPIIKQIEVYKIIGPNMYYGPKRRTINSGR